MSRVHTIAANKFVRSIKRAKVIDTFTDDHIPCATVRLNNDTRSYYWCGHDFIGAVEYFDSPKAKNRLAEFFANEIETQADIIQDLETFLIDNDEINEADVRDSDTIVDAYAFLEFVGIAREDVPKYMPGN